MPNYFEVGKQGMNVLVACVFSKIAIYKIEVATG